MAGQGRKIFEANEVLTAADVNGYLMDQSVMVFDDSTARDAAIGTPTEGMIAYLKDTDTILKYTTTWENISNPGDITAVTAGTALTGGGTSGDVTLDVDLSAIEKPSDIITTQGDLIIGDASGNPVRLPVGSADQVLTSDGTTVSFQDAGGGGGITLLASASAIGLTKVTITNIDQTYKKLIIFGKDLSANSGAVARCNLNDANTYYAYSGAEGYSTRNTSSTTSNVSPGDVSSNETITFYLEIMNYSDSRRHTVNGSSAIQDVDVGSLAGTNFTAAPITSVSFNLQNAQMDSGTLEVYGVN